MAIGLTARQRNELAAMLPNVDESVASLRRLIADAKDRTRALAKLSEAEDAHKRHASDVGIPFNAEAFAMRRAELNALPKMLTVEEGQLASFTALQRAIGVILGGRYVREGRGSTGASRKKQSKKSAPKRAGRKKTSARSKKQAPARTSNNAQRASQRSTPRVAARAAVVTPLPLSLGS